MNLQKENSNNNKLLFFIKEISREIFVVTLSTYFIFYLLDFLFNDFISNFLNLNILLVIIIITSFITFGLQKKYDSDIEKKIPIKEAIYYVIFSLIAGIIIYSNIKTIGNIAILISILSSISIFLITYLIVKNNFKED